MPENKLSQDKIECCSAVMPFGDDHGDNSCTFRCLLAIGHLGKHKEWGKLHGKYPYVLEWEGDYRDEQTEIYFFWNNVEESFANFAEIADRLGLEYVVERDDGDINIKLDGRAKEKYYIELERLRNEVDEQDEGETGDAG